MGHDVLSTTQFTLKKTQKVNSLSAVSPVSTPCAKIRPSSISGSSWPISSTMRLSLNRISKMAASTFLTLNDGIKMPQFGIGLFNVTENINEVIQSAVTNGYRMFDTAKYYENEVDIGLALKNSGLKREDYFVVTKLWISDHGYEETKKAFNESLNKLALDYVDLYLIHSPSGGKIINTWKAMSEMKRDGLIRSIGVSNFNTHHLDKLKEACEKEGFPLPSVNQIELHPWLQQRKVVKYCQDLGIAMMGFCPLARCVKFGKCSVLEKISQKLNKTQAQVVLRWAMQKEFLTIPKSSSPERIKENAGIFGFELTHEDMENIDGLDDGMRVSTDAMERPWVE